MAQFSIWAVKSQATGDSARPRACPRNRPQQISTIAWVHHLHCIPPVQGCPAEARDLSGLGRQFQRRVVRIGAPVSEIRDPLRDHEQSAGFPQVRG
jgi:hypothetical protein